jgi:hypothetical protein
MRRKPQPPADPAESGEIVAPEIREEARRLLEAELPKLTAKCSVCGAEASPNPLEQLCWVCRRLKISAWRDVEQQIPVQE